MIGPVPIRQEIRSLEKNFPDLWTLYVLGLKVFQEADENDLLSYYRISGQCLTVRLEASTRVDNLVSG